MRWLWILSLPLILGFTRIHWDYERPEYVREEFSNLETNVQDQSFTVFTGTPTLSDLKDGQIVIVSSGTFNKLMYRIGQEVFSVDVSCVTYIR